MAFLPRKFASSFFYLPIGITYFIVLTAVISNIANLPTGKAAISTFLGSLILLFFRLRFDVNYPSTVRILLKHFIVAPYILSILFFKIFDLLKLDFAGRNFDAYYAIQDGDFLSNHSVTESVNGLLSNSLLPLDWSASPDIRYGMSYVIAAHKYFLGSNSWISAQGFFCLFFIMQFFVYYSLVRTLFRTTSLQSTLISIFAILAPLNMLHFEYFMFGQALALPIFVFSFVLFSSERRDYSVQILQILSMIALFVAYPAMFYPMLLFYVIFEIVSLSQSRNHLKPVVSLVLMVFAILLVNDFNFEIILSRILSWVIGGVNPNAIIAQSSDIISIPIFSQFSSLLGFPLTLGLISYPFQGLRNFGIALLLLLASILMILFALIPSNSWKNLANQLRIFYLYLVFWFSIPLFAYFRGNSYLFFKVMVWIAPVFTLILAANLLLNFHPGAFKLSRNLFKSSFLVIFISLSLFAQFLTSFSYLKTIREWDSFPQRPVVESYPALESLTFPSNSIVAISTPTAEEATWTAGIIGEEAVNFFSLGASDQALAVGLSRRCELSYIQKHFDSVNYLIENAEKQDVVENLVFDSASSQTRLGWQKYFASDLESGVVANGAGSYPPTFLTYRSSPVNNTKTIRWSSGQICLSIFSKDSDSIKLQLDYANGPDIGPMPFWEGSLNSQSLPLVVSGQKISTSLNLDPGWNLLQIAQKSCKDPMENFNRWSRRADDRLLCFAFGSVRTFRSN